MIGLAPARFFATISDLLPRCDSDDCQSGGSELRRGKRKEEEEEEEREVEEPLFSSLFFLFSLPASLVGTSSRLRIAVNLQPPGG